MNKQLNTQIEDISSKLDKIIKLLAISCSEKFNVRRQVEVLTDVGFTPKQISNILDKSPNLVRVMKHTISKYKEEKR
jgi:hypothetical protein